ncbi:MAG: adenylate/guanylate cyclase domain-containing protein [Sulfuriflexus sp.]|nr:adenylate/guanylate cyclase domain-containing protein [Sulfuriflexus sp.]
MNDVTPANIRKLIGQGEYLSAYDAAISQTDNEEFHYLAVLSLARSGATTRAQKLFNEFGFADSDNEDYAALGARLAKDLALSSTNKTERNALFEQAAGQYHDVFNRTGGYYTAINAASLYKLSGDTTLAVELAKQTLTLCEQEPSGQGLGEYYRLVSMAEALLVLDDLESAKSLLNSAREHVENDYAAMATTRRQLALLIPEQQTSFLSALTPPGVIHFCGHMISNTNDSGRFRPQAEQVVKESIVNNLAELDIGFGYGSLANGADILFAEALLERGARLHIVLPFDMDEFIEVSVKPAGAEWTERFYRCIDKANFVSYSCDGSYLGDNTLFHYATRLAMGLALQKSRNLQTSVKQVAVWDGETSTGAAGTYADIQSWQLQDHDAILLSATDGKSLSPPDKQTIISAELDSSQRRAHAMLFGDVKGFSKLNDEQIPAFVEQLFGALAVALKPFNSSVLSTNTWGDGLFVVFKDALSASQCAIALQVAMQNIDLASAGLPPHLALRLGVHYGPIYELEDPVLHRTNYFGAHVTKAARIEPITPEGEVYVTRQLAAELALENNSGFTTEYVGVVPTAKKYGDMPMYLLRTS